MAQTEKATLFRSKKLALENKKSSVIQPILVMEQILVKVDLTLNIH